MANIATRLYNLDEEETEALNGMNARERRRFNALPDINAKLDMFEHSWSKKNLGEKNRKLNSKLLADIIELGKENSKISELKKKFAELEAENAKLRLELRNWNLVPGKRCPNNSSSSYNSVTKQSVSPDCKINDAVPKAPADTKSPEEMEMDAFLEMSGKSQYSGRLRNIRKALVKRLERGIGRKKLLHETASQKLQTIPQNIAYTTSHAESVGPNSGNSGRIVETVNNVHDQKIELDLLQGFLVDDSHMKFNDIEFIDIEPSNDLPAVAELAYLFHQTSVARKNSIKAKREEILSWGISDEYLRKITSKVRKINKLFGYDYDPVTLRKNEGIGWHVVNRIAYSADSISRLTNLQIQYIIDQVNLTADNETVNNVHDPGHDQLIPLRKKLSKEMYEKAEDDSSSSETNQTIALECKRESKTWIQLSQPHPPNLDKSEAEFLEYKWDLEAKLGVPSKAMHK
ncbi:hypothetical protein C1645_826253 [Glomus cerebriforme]|uniref:Uncharacterized protein n=1 Tax=Glomus cerebriforme TaxID=658196 RepID=A0A397SR94_9GLOM|nr:hypothetical protein C1645_826253 [Glomus cerebriforme]